MFTWTYTECYNESLKGMIWNKCPKSTYRSAAVLKTGVSSAVICFNNGFIGSKVVFSKLNINLN